MEEDKQEEESHAKARSGKEGDAFAPLRLCVRCLQQCRFRSLLCSVHSLRHVVADAQRAARTIPTTTCGWPRTLSSTGRSAAGHTPTAYRPPLYPLVLSRLCVARRLRPRDRGSRHHAVARCSWRGDRRAGVAVGAMVGIGSRRRRRGRAAGRLRSNSVGQFVAGDDRDAGHVSHNGRIARVDLGGATADNDSIAGSQRLPECGEHAITLRGPLAPGYSCDT